MRVALTDIANETFETPAEIVSVRIDKATGKLTTKTDKSSLFEYFDLGTVPTEYISTDNSSDIFQDDGDDNNEEELF